MFKNKKLNYILIPIILVIIAIIICINVLNNRKKEETIQAEKQRVLQYSNISDFQSIEEVFLYLDSELLSKEESDLENVDYILKAKIKHDPDESMKNYYEKLIQYSAHAMEYKNFYIIDENKNINIFVLCNSETQTVLKYYINNQESYFEKIKSNRNIEEFAEAEENSVSEISVKIASEELQQIISKNWKTDGIDLGEKDSLYRNYDVYFDEGYEIRKINGAVFNIIFTNKYENEIIENIKIDTTKEEIIKKLGEPAFSSNDVWGYKTEKFYIFFSSKQVSIYPIVEYDTSKFIEIIQKNKDSSNVTELIDGVKNIWRDYDKYEYDSNYVILQYTLKGICLKYDFTAQKGIIFYNNYNGLVDENTSLQSMILSHSQLPEKMYFENLDLVFENEKARIATLDDYTEYGNVKTGNILNISNQFKVYQDATGQIRFISIDKQVPNSELKENISYGIWCDDYTFLYSVQKKGIYMYDAVNRKYKTILEGNEEFQIKDLSADKLTLFYDDTAISINK